MKTIVFAATYLLWIGGWQCHEGFFSSLFFFFLYIGMLWLAWQQTFWGGFWIGIIMKVLGGPTGLIMSKWVMTPLAVVAYFAQLNQGRDHLFGYLCDSQAKGSSWHAVVGLVWCIWMYFTVKGLIKKANCHEQ